MCAKCLLSIEHSFKSEKIQIGINEKDPPWITLIAANAMSR